MATNPPEEEIILVRGSAAYKEYIRHQGGWLKAVVNGLEDYLSTSGRLLLLVFILYTTIKGGMAVSGHGVPEWLDIIMLGFQVGGLEGSIPGLTRLRETMLTRRREEDARVIKRAIYSSRTLNLLTGIEIVLAAHPSTSIGPMTMAEVNGWYGSILLLVRLFMITGFLIAMARMEKKAPKVISQEEYDQRQQEAEQEQIRMDNVSIQKSISEALTAWTLEQERRQRGEHENRQALIEKRLRDFSSEQGRSVAEHLASMRQELEDLQSASQQSAEEHHAVVSQLQTDLQTANLLIVELQHADLQTANQHEEYHLQSATLQSANLQISDLTASLQAANLVIADLQKGNGERAEAHGTTGRVTSIEQARAKHDAESQGGRTKMSHADVLAFMALNQGMKRSEVAERLGISERKVYDAVAWQREQMQDQGGTVVSLS